MLHKLLNEVTAKRFSVFGIPFDAGLYYCSIGIILGLLGVWQLGPLLGLRSSYTIPEVPWLFVMSAEGKMGCALEARERRLVSIR